MKRVEPGHFRLDVLESRPPSASARLVGEVDLYTAPRLREGLRLLLDEGGRFLTLDLSELDFIDSTGLAELVGALKRFRQVGGEVVLYCPSRSIAKVLEISGLDRVFTISSDAACAS